MAHAPLTRADLLGHYDFSIPPQSLASALIQFSKQADVQVVGNAATIANLDTAGVSGQHSAREALRLLLGAHALIFQEVTSRSVRILPQEEVAQPSSANQANHAERIAQENTVHDAARNTIQDATPLDQRSERAAGGERIELEEILVTGSRLKRSETVGPSPVITITKRDIERSGAATVREVLNALPQTAVSRDESATSFAGASTVQLRGLSAGSTLVLINGRRASAYNESSFDLNSLPLEAIERIEVLTSTASAIYGADAIGGAVNFILRRSYEGVGVSLGYGTSSHGDASEREAVLFAGDAGDKYSGLAVVSVYDRDPLLARDRELTRSSDFRRFGGLDLRSTASYPANVYALPGNGNLPGLNSRFASVPAGSDGIGLTPADFAATDGVLNRYNSMSSVSLGSEATRLGVFTTGSVQVGPTIRLFGEALYSRNEQPVQTAADVLFGGAFGFFIVPAENPFNPFGVPVGVDYRFEELGPRTLDGTMTYSRAVVGAGGPLLSRLEWELSVLYDRNEQKVVTRNAVNAFDPAQAVLVQQYLSSTDPNVALNVFSSTGNNNPQTLQALLNETTSQSTVKGLVAEAQVRGPLFQLATGEVQIAVGASSRRDEAAFADDITAPLDRSKTSWALFAETAIPLVSAAQSVPGIHSAEATIAVRRDEYDTFGGETNPQFGLLWRPAPSLLIRGSYGEAFKAPTLYDLYSVGEDFVQFLFDPLRDDELVDIVLHQGGNPNVKPEQGEALAFGAIWEPQFAPGLSFGATAFRLEHTDLITRFLDFTAVLSHPELFGDRIVRAAPTPEDQQAGRPGRLLSLDMTTLNFGRVTVRGVDAELRYAFAPTGLGSFTWSAFGSYIDEYEIQLTPDALASNEVGHANRAGYPTRFKASSQLGWSGQRGFGASLTARYLHSYADYVDFVDVQRKMDAQTLWDLQASYQGSVFNVPGISISLGVINLADEQGSYSNSGLGYDFQQADIRGRFIYMNLKKEF